MLDPQYRTLYRIVLTDPPSVRGMLSYHALGKQPVDTDDEALHLSRGISLYNIEQQARIRAAGLPWMGMHSLRNCEYPMMHQLL